MKILFITSTRVGDAILSTGLLAHLLQEHPTARITIACGPAAAPLFEAVPNLERIVALDKMIFSMHWLTLLSKTAIRFWDIIVDLRNSSMYYVLAGRKRYRMGRTEHEEHRVIQLSRVLGLSDNPPSPHIWESDENQELAEQLIPEGMPVLAVGPTANWKAKTWRPHFFAELIERLCAPDGILPGGRVAIFGRDDERPMALQLIEEIPVERRLDLIGHLDLPEAYSCLKRSSLYIGNDSGLMHLAAASSIPTLGLFGPSLESFYSPWGKFCASIRGLPFDETFPEDFDHRTSDTLMDSLTVDIAEQAARDLWKRTQEAAL